MPGNTCDLLIIGGGFAGTALAYHAAKSGADVLLLEAGSMCSGTSAACAGRAQIIESETEDYLELVLAGFSKLETLSKELEVDLEWELPGHLTLLFNEDQMRQYERLTERLSRRGIPAALMDMADLHAAEPSLRVEACIGAAYSHEGHLNPFKFCLGFARAAIRYGAELRTHTQVTGFVRKASRITHVWAGNEHYSAGIIMLAAGAWAGELAKMAGCRLPMRFTHAEALVSEPLPQLIHHHIGMSGFYDAVHGQERTVTLGVGQHRNGALMVSNAIQQAETIERASTAWGIPAIVKAVYSFLPTLKKIRIIRAWAAPSPFLPDYLPAIGRLPGLDNLYVAAGFHLAIPTIPLLAEASVHSVMGTASLVENMLLKAFSPDRFSAGNVH